MLLTDCLICRSPVAEAIDKMLRDGMAVTAVQAWMEDGGFKAPHRNTFTNHRPHMERVEERREEIHREAERVRRVDEDLAVLVRDRVVDRIANEEVKPTITEGLRAQELLDRRAEKQGDRQVVFTLAMVMSGAIKAGEIEGIKRLADPAELPAN